MRKNARTSAILKKLAAVFALICFLAMPQKAWANAGTPLMWASMLHMLFGNFFIGLVEGLSIGLIFRVPKIKAMGLMIMANYFSAWAGGYGLISIFVDDAKLDLYTAWPFLWKMVAVAYLVTLVLEFPFVALCFWKKKHWFGKAILASLLVQTVSYALLFGWYYGASATTLYTETQLVEPSEMTLPEDVSLYYISAEDGDVYRQHLGKQDDVKVFELDSVNNNERLMVRSSSYDNDRWDLLAPITRPGETKAEFVTVRSSFPGKAAPSYQSIHEESADRIGTWFNLGPAPKLADAKDSPWEFEVWFWPWEGLGITKKGGGPTRRIAFETPVAQWAIRNATHLPDDTVVFQLGRDQICAYHPETKKLALVARGRGPVAVIEEPPDDSSKSSKE